MEHRFSTQVELTAELIKMSGGVYTDAESYTVESNPRWGTFTVTFNHNNPTLTISTVHASKVIARAENPRNQDGSHPAVEEEWQAPRDVSNMTKIKFPGLGRMLANRAGVPEGLYQP